jgi:hypothetical protein
MKLNVGRNDPCPCGSGKKFKNCHLGREMELLLRRDEPLSPSAAHLICALPEVTYGRSAEMAAQVAAVTGSAVKLKFVDLAAYHKLGFGGAGRQAPGSGVSAGVFINPIKTRVVDPDRLYLAVSRHVSDSTLIHQLAHVLHYLNGDPPGPDLTGRLSLETGIPVEQLEHTAQYAHWLEFFGEKFAVEPDAEDAIVLYLHQQGLLLDDAMITNDQRTEMLVTAERLMRHMRTHAAEIDELIKSRPGYIGPASERAEGGDQG